MGITILYIYIYIYIKAHEATKLGLRVSPNTITNSFGKAYKKQLEKTPFYGIHQGMSTEQWWEELVYGTFLLSGINKKDLDNQFPALFQALYTRFKTKEGYCLFPDVVPTLKELKRNGFIMGVISNSDERLINVMESFKLDQYFDFILPSCLAGYEKPRAEIFNKSLQLVREKNISPEDCLHVGDDIEKDYFGAVNAGWNGVLLERSKLSYEDYSPALILSDSNRHTPKKILTLHDLYPLACHLRPAENNHHTHEHYHPLQAADHH
ncbi:unnamed protein product [Cunninghamella blakesleeana]